MPDDPKVTESRPVPDVQVAIISTGDGSRLPTGTVAVTPGHNQPNIVTTVVTPMMAIAIRFANNYLQTLLGIVTAGMATNIIPFTDFADLLTKSAMVSLVPAAVALLKDTITIFSRLEQSHPLSTGSI